ncbi:MAG: hypothetical protein ACTS7I_00080 [Candidatus Hodgkinia cicadicola]
MRYLKDLNSISFNKQQVDGANEFSGVSAAVAFVWRFDVLNKKFKRFNLTFKTMRRITKPFNEKSINVKCSLQNLKLTYVVSNLQILVQLYERLFGNLSLNEISNKVKFKLLYLLTWEGWKLNHGTKVSKF